MKRVFLYFIKAVATLYFFIFVVAAIDIMLALATDKTESLVLGFTADLFSLFISVIVVSALAFIISIPVKPAKPTN